MDQQIVVRHSSRKKSNLAKNLLQTKEQKIRYKEHDFLWIFCYSSIKNLNLKSHFNFKRKIQFKMCKENHERFSRA